MGLAISRLAATIHRGLLFISNTRQPTRFSLAIPVIHRDGIEPEHSFDRNTFNYSSGVGSGN